MARLFGTDGVRGIANRELTPELAFKLAFYSAQVLSKKLGEQTKLKILIAKDTRISGDLLEQSMCAGFCSAGADVFCAGVLPTPAVAYLNRSEGFHAGVMISASHNSFEFNGIKFISASGYKLTDVEEDEISALVEGQESLGFTRPYGEKLGVVHYYPQGKELYIRYLRYAAGVDLSGWRIAMDTANGSAYQIAPTLFKALGAELIVMADQPNGVNINKACGSTHVEALQQLVLEHQCDLGLAYDGDADRLQVVDNLGEKVDGDSLMALFALYLKEKGKLNEDTLVATVMSNLGLRKFAKNYGIHLETTAVGDRYVLERMREKNLSLGGEQSGHMIFSELSTTGDGILSSLILMKALKKQKQSLSEARKILTIYPQVLKGVHVPNDKKSFLLAHPDLEELHYQFKETLGESGRILIRASGTEPLIRVMIEGEDLSQIETMAEALVQCIEKNK